MKEFLKASTARAAMVGAVPAIWLSFGTGAAYAQDANGGAIEADGLDVIIVTSERREGDLQKVPLAVTALPATTLDERQIVSTLDLQRAVPNLVASNTVGLGSSVTYFLRGVGNTESIPTFDLPIGTYVDEVFISRQSGNQIALSGVERVEVLRGPQGTLFGRNTTGGAVSIITKKPDYEFGAELEVGYGSFDRAQVSGAINAPLGDNAAIRVSGIYVTDDGYTENLFNGDTFNGEETGGGRVALRIEPTDRITWDASVQYIETDNLALGTPAIIDPTTGVISRTPVTGDLQTVRINDQDCEANGDVTTFPSQGCTFSETKSTLAISNFGIDLDFGSLNFITGYYETGTRFNIDFLGNTDQPVFGGLFGANFFISTDTQTKQFSQEVKLNGEFANDAISYTIGAFYLDEQNETFFADSVNLPLGPDVTVPLTLASRAPLANSTESYAFYGQTDISVTDALTVQLGARWTNEEKQLALDGVSLNFATFSNDPLDSAALVAAGIPLEQEVSRFTPRAAVFYDVADDISFYGSYTRGFRSGGWNVRGTSAIELQPFGPESVDSFELGFRSELFDNLLRLNATAFHATYDDFQVPSAFPGSSQFLTLNSGTARVIGLEVDFLLALANSFDIFGNFGLQDGDYTELTDGAIAAGIGPELQRTPTFSGQIGASKAFDIGDNEVRFGADVSHTGSHDQSPTNDPESFVDALTTLNAQMAWTLPARNVTLIAECTNCTDKVISVQSLFGLLYPSQPRRLGIRAKFEF